MKKTILCLLVLFFFICNIAVEASPKKKPIRYTIDNFEDGNINSNPEWWTFGSIVVQDKNNDVYSEKYLGKHSIQITGQTSTKIVGGMGVYLGLDVRKYNMLKLFIHGNGPDSGIIQIQFFDDDNNNDIIERHPIDVSRTKFDDMFIYNLKVDWAGWKVKLIPLTYFRDVNYKVGDDIWNPYQKDKSSGLIQTQFVFMTENNRGKCNIMIDEIKLYHDKRKFY